jgi:DNA mismatch endonuclease (patch repair protein)
MRRIRTNGTKPELAVREVLQSMGYEYELQREDLPGTPDIVLPEWRTAVFVHGCFWHGHEKCDRGRRVPKTNRQMWVTKIAQNRERDARVKEQLETAGWRVVVIWDCETRDPAKLERIISTLFPTATA